MRWLSVLLGLVPNIAFAGGLTVSNAWVPTAPPGAMAHAAYMTIGNDGSEPLNIVGVRADGYMKAHIHMSVEADGVSSMSPVHQIEVLPNQSVELAPGGMHLMLMRPTVPIAKGDTVLFRFELMDGTSLTTTAIVRDRNAGS